MTPPPPWPLGQTLQLGLGIAGILSGAFWARLFWKVVSGPGDDNPVALLFLVALALSVVPAWGLVRASRSLPLRRGKLWLVVSVPTLGGLGMFAAVFW